MGIPYQSVTSTNILLRDVTAQLHSPFKFAGTRFRTQSRGGGCEGGGSSDGGSCVDPNCVACITCDTGTCEGCGGCCETCR